MAPIQQTSVFVFSDSICRLGYQYCQFATLHERIYCALRIGGEYLYREIGFRRIREIVQTCREQPTQVHGIIVVPEDGPLLHSHDQGSAYQQEPIWLHEGNIQVPPILP